jgi:hypothetical protein
MILLFKTGKQDFHTVTNFLVAEVNHIFQKVIGTDNKKQYQIIQMNFTLHAFKSLIAASFVVVLYI